jgi:signal transduction histidine kinase
MARNKKYIPEKRYNPAALSNSIEQLKKEIQSQKESRDLILQSMENHFEHLVNFSSHDMKNCLQNLDSTIYNITVEDFNEEQLKTIVLCLDNLRTSIDDFINLVPKSSKKDFDLFELINAAEVINRTTFHEKKITFSNLFEKDSSIRIYQPFHVLLQVINNLIINAIKALDLSENDNKRLELNTKISEGNVLITISDNGIGIPAENKQKIFSFYFTTTGGSGIGLCHAKHSLNEINGSVELQDSSEIFNTIFLIKFPIGNEK